jgi:hypothetical protein
MEIWTGWLMGIDEDARVRIQAGGGSIDGRVWGESQCSACYAACMRYGFWPWQANGKPCPGA